MKKFFKIFCAITTLVIALTFSTVLAVEADVQINGKIIDFTDSQGNKVNAQLINSRTMVPLRKIFEILGCQIDWNGETRTVIAQKDGKEIILQINNKVAIKKENGVEEKINLDTAPVILNNRTLVPLRFVAESLDKQVGWDSSTYTAIIIDYDYFANLINQKNPVLYNVLTSDGNMSFSITRNYADLDNSVNNNNATIKGNVIKNVTSSNITLNFEGNNELIQEIIAEGWGNINYEAIYAEDSMSVKISNSTIAKLLGVNTNDFATFDYIDLKLTGDARDDLSGAIRNMFNIDEKKLNISTFNKLETEFNRVLNLFVQNGTRNLSYNNAKLNTFDYTRFDSVIYNNEMSKTLSFINKAIFNYDFAQDEILYDWNKITYTMNCENNNMVLKLALENEYNEKVNYTIYCEAK